MTLHISDFYKFGSDIVVAHQVVKNYTRWLFGSTVLWPVDLYQLVPNYKKATETLLLSCK